MEGLDETQEEAKKGRQKKEKELKPVELFEQNGAYYVDLYKLPLDAEIVCELEQETVEYSKNKNKNELVKKKVQRGYTKGFFSGIFDLNENGYSQSLELTILGYK